jgi:hypothetical protein
MKAKTLEVGQGLLKEIADKQDTVDLLNSATGDITLLEVTFKTASASPITLKVKDTFRNQIFANIRKIYADECADLIRKFEKL